MANLSKIKRERMLEYLEKLKEQNNDDENIRAITEIENALNEKKYGLVWEEHSEQVDEMLEHNIPVFTEIEERKIIANDEESFNFLLEGDNLHSLKLLEKTHKGMIDIIYIDPPYNTKNKEFIYNDTQISEEDSYRHSKWLSFMEERLASCRNLLKESGVIFISIDDIEQAQLKMLCDSVFGEVNFIGQSIIASNSSKNNSNFIAINHEYVLSYAKNIENTPKGWLVKKNQVEEYEKRANQLIKMGLTNEEIHNELLQLVKYPRFYDLDHYTYADDNGVYQTDNSGGVKNGNFTTEILHPITGEKCKKPSGGWRYNPETLNKLIKNNEIHFGDDETVIPRIKRYLHDYPMQVPKSTVYFDSQSSTKWMKKNNLIFDFPKATEFIKHLLSYTGNKDALILDFFAGSGTTGHAVAQLNKEDGGNRKYILCTNNENNICEEVTYQRLKNIQNDLPHNLKYYKTDFIEKFSQGESISEKMLSHIRELIELEHHLEIDDKHTIILENEDDIESVINRIEDGGKLFIVSGIFLSRSEQRTLEKKRIEMIEIPEYYFREELREVGEV